VTRVVVTIVEGHGDTESLPILLRLIDPSLRIPTPVRVPKSRLIRAGTGLADAGVVARYARIALSNVRADELADKRFLLLLLLDADDDCPATLGPSLLEAMRSTTGHAAHCFAAVAKREFESWIIGGHPDINEQDPDAAGSPKKRIAAINGGKYKESVDQPRFTSRIDLERLGDRSPSFRRLADRLRDFADSR